LDRASELADKKEEVMAALFDIMQRHDEKPPEEIPVQPVVEPQSPAGTETVQGIIKNMMGEPI